MHLLRKHIEAISPLTDEEFDYILSHFITRKIKKHAFLVQILQLTSNDHWISAGVVTSKDSVLPFPTTGVLRNGKYYVLNGKLAELFDVNAKKTSNFLLQEIKF
jgi:hypothetical protein